jgi:hypothetical protein
MTENYSPKDFFEKMLRYWFYIPIAMVIGGLVGLIINGFIPPIYEAQAKFLVTIDYTRTGYLSDIQEDQAMRGIGSLIGSDFILKKTIDVVNSIYPDISFSDIKEKARLERGEFEWFIRIRDNNPQIASDLVNYWAEQANDVVQEALNHSFEAERLFQLLDSYELCLQRMTMGVGSMAQCSSINLDQLILDIQKVGAKAYQEKESSRGLMPAASVNLVEKSLVPIKPVVFARNAFVLAGALLGLILILFLIIKMDYKKARKSTRGK